MAFELATLLGGKRRAAPVPVQARERANLDNVLQWALARAGEDIRFPVAYVEFLRTCLEQHRLSLRTVKRSRGEGDSVRRFAALLGALADLPALEWPVADALARIADDYLGNATPIESGQWSGDVRAHFEMTSSFGHKGRILTAVVRFMRSTRCLELGTAYGMSALFLLESLSARGQDVHLVTVEGLEQLYRMASALLQGRYHGRVRCEFGRTGVVLPRLAQTLAPVDVLFHDAGHSRKDYVNDFNAALPLLAPGAVVLIDDINWHDPRFAAGNPQCRKGWQEVAAHPRVSWAVEIDGELGLALLS